jgi:tryptophan synthase beta chain
MNNLKQKVQSKDGYFGEFGGSFIPLFLEPIFEEINEAFHKYKNDAEFLEELKEYQTNFVGRPSPLVYLKNLTTELGGAKIYYKNEGVIHTGAHKINHCLGQILIAKRLGKTRIIAETGAGQHGVATATVCAKLGLECVIYMGAKDYNRQRPNVFYMESMGATVIAVNEGAKTLREAINAAMQDLISNPKDTYYLLGTVCGPNPYPSMNAFFQSIISKESKMQINEFEERMPDYVVACLGGGSNAMGAFFEYLDEPRVQLVAVEAGGKSNSEDDLNCEHAARFINPKTGVAQGYKSIFLQNDNGQLKETYSISAGLDYAGVGPQIAFLQATGRIKVVNQSDQEVLEAFKILASKEGIIAALESLHAVSYALKLAPILAKDKIIIINGSGRGDKDLFITANKLDSVNFKNYLTSQLDA